MCEDFENRDSDEIVIDLREVFGILKKKIKTVLGITVVFLAVAGAYAFFWPKTYESVTLLRIREPQNFATSSIGNGIKYLTDCNISHYGKIAVSSVVRNFVGEELRTIHGDSVQQDFAKSTVSTRNERNSDVLTVSVAASNPKLAQEINRLTVDKANKEYLAHNIQTLDNEIALINSLTRKTDNTIDMLVQLQIQREEVMSCISVIEPSTFNSAPVSPKKVRTLAIALVLGLICGSMYVVVKEKM